MGQILFCQAKKPLNKGFFLCSLMPLQVYDGYSAEKIPLVDSIKKLKFIYKKDLVSCLNDIMKNLEEKKYV